MKKISSVIFLSFVIIFSTCRLCEESIRSGKRRTECKTTHD